MKTEQEQYDEEELAAMEAGFGDIVTVDPGLPAEEPEATSPAATQPAPASTPTQPTPAAAPQPTDDPFKDLPAAARDMLALVPQMHSELQRMGVQLRETVGRSAALQSRLDKLNNTPADGTPPPKKFTKVEDLRNKLPEIAEAFDELAASMAPAPEPAPPPSAELSPEAQAALRAKTDKFLTDMRPTWGPDLMSTDFQLWLQTQPPTYRDEVQMTSEASVVLKALDAFDARGAAAPSASTPPPPPSTPPADSRRARMEAGVVPAGDGRRGGRVVADPDPETSAMDAAFAIARPRRVG